MKGYRSRLTKDTIEAKKMLRNAGIEIYFDIDTQQWLFYGEKRSYQAEKGHLTTVFAGYIIDCEKQ